QPYAYRVRSSPRAWGCTALASAQLAAMGVVPTRVGVYRPGAAGVVTDACRPHARGGVPPTANWRMASSRSSPRAWGCTGLLGERRHAGSVVPTRVGVYRR